MIADLIHRYTSGYPYLVGKICEIIVEELCNDFTEKGIEKEPLPWALRFGYEGMSVVLTDHMNAPIKEHVRHAVIQPDGHLYGSWDDPSDIII